jgi:hypothetical protein
VLYKHRPSRSEYAIGALFALRANNEQLINTYPLKHSNTINLRTLRNPHPTALVSTDCPSSNTSPGGNAVKYTFTKRCGFDTNGTNLVSAFVTDLDLCIALCSNWNYQQTQGDKCNSVSFNVDGSPPGNCWAKTGTGLKVVSGQGAATLE